MTHEFTVGFPFCGIGGGAIGFLEAEARLFGRGARFRSVGGIDCDAMACRDFETLTGSPALCADIATLTASELRAFMGEQAPDVIFSSPPCLPGHVTVLTESGPRAIETVRAGDLVLTHKGRLRRVRAVGCEPNHGLVYGFRLNGTVDTQEFTAEHPIWRRRVVRWSTGPKGRARSRSLGAAEFVRAEEIERGDRIGFPVTPERVGTAREFIESFGDPRAVVRGGASEGRYAKPEHVATLPRIVDLRPHAEVPALWFLVGAYLGDGYLRQARHESIFCVGAAGGELAARIRGAVHELGLGVRMSDEGGPTNVKLHVDAKHLCEILAAFGQGAENKRIPERLMTLERAALDALVEGYRATDGSESPRRTAGTRGQVLQARWRIVSVSLQLLRDVQRLLLRRGEYGRIHVAWPGGEQTIMGRVVQTLPRWELSVALEPKKRTAHEFIDGAVWVRVRDVVRRPGGGELVWNLDVEEDDTFCAPMIATHNCKGFSGLLSEKQAKQARYRKLNKLVLDWVRLMLEAWPQPPRLFLLENVPRIAGPRGKRFLAAVRARLRRAGYVFHQGTHDAGELGGLAQRRQRFLLVARHPGRCAPLLYQPPKKRVRGCGEVLEALPLPGDGGANASAPSWDDALSWRLLQRASRSSSRWQRPYESIGTTHPSWFLAPTALRRLRARSSRNGKLRFNKLPMNARSRCW